MEQYLWNQAHIRVIDVRHLILHAGDAIEGYQLPSSTFLFVTKGAANITMNQALHIVDGFYVLHGGKGTVLTVSTEKELEYYLILYKAVLPITSRLELRQIWDQYQPFQTNIAFSPLHPLSLFSPIEKMNAAWEKRTDFDKLQAKALMYQFVVELLYQMDLQGIKLGKRDLVERVIRYMQENFQQYITLDSIATEFECSVGYLSKLFKKKMKVSPMYYVGELRMNHAAHLLIHSDATLQEIAEAVAVLDAHSLSRSFKKYKGVSPSQYKQQWKQKLQGEYLPSNREGFAILPMKLRRYNDDGIENHYQLEGDVNTKMYRSMKVTAMTIVLCLSLMLSACSTTTNNTNGSANSNGVQSSTNSNTATNSVEATTTVNETRIVSTKRGDVEVPANPQRVVADQYMGHLLKLGIVPVGVREFMLTEGWMQDSGIAEDVFAGIENLGGFPMDLEKLVDIQPDLIIGSIEDNIEQYEKVGTTVFVPYWEELSTAGPLDKFRSISEIFGKEAEAEAWITEFESNVESAKKEIAGIVKEGETVSVIQVATKAIFVLAAEGGNYGSPMIYQMLDLPPTQQALDMEQGFAQVSLEVLSDYLGDHTFVYINSAEDAEEILDSNVWKQSKAVQNGNVYMYGQFGDEFVMEDPFSLEQQLETIKNVMLENK